MSDGGNVVFRIYISGNATYNISNKTEQNEYSDVENCIYKNIEK